MARIARVVAPGLPHHIIQRGNRRQSVFIRDNDYSQYLNLLGTYSQRFRVDVLSYCLMPNHIHLIVVPRENGNLAQAIGETHRNYTRFVNYRENWKGYLWQGRFSSYILDDNYLLAATRYILLNPVRAGIVSNPWEYEWSGARYHMRMNNSYLIKDNLLQEIITDWKEFLNVSSDRHDVELLKLHERTGRPLGNSGFIDKLESTLKINLKKKRAGRKKKEK